MLSSSAGSSSRVVVPAIVREPACRRASPTCRRGKNATVNFDPSRSLAARLVTALQVLLLIVALLVPALVLADDEQTDPAEPASSGEPLIADEALSAVTPDVTPEAPQANPTPEPTPEPDPTPDARPEPTPRDEATPKPEPTPEPDPTPDARPEPTPRDEATPKPEPTPEPTDPDARRSPRPETRRRRAGAHPGAGADPRLPRPEPSSAPDRSPEPSPVAEVADPPSPEVTDESLPAPRRLSHQHPPTFRPLQPRRTEGLSPSSPQQPQEQSRWGPRRRASPSPAAR